MQRRAHESTSGVPVQWPVSVVQKPLGLRQSEKIPSKNFRVQRLEMAKQMKNIRQQRADERDKAAQIFTWCMVVAMHQEEGIGATRLERACNEMHEFQQRYRTKILTENRKSATDAMREDLKGICDFEVRLPQTKASRNRREEQLRMAQNEGAEIAWLVMAATRKNSKSTICGKAKIISCPAAPQKPRGQICCGQWRPYRLRWQQSAALPASRWPF